MWLDQSPLQIVVSKQMMLHFSWQHLLQTHQFKSTERPYASFACITLTLCLSILGSELLLAQSFFVQVSHGPTDGKNFGLALTCFVLCKQPVENSCCLLRCITLMIGQRDLPQTECYTDLWHGERLCSSRAFHFAPLKRSPQVEAGVAMYEHGNVQIVCDLFTRHPGDFEPKTSVEGPYADLTICSAKATGCNGGDSDRCDWHNSCLHIPAEAFRGLLPWITSANEINSVFNVHGPAQRPYIDLP